MAAANRPEDPRSGRVAAKIRSRDVTRIQNKVWDKDHDEDQNIDSMIKYICTLGGMAQVIAPKFPVAELGTPHTTQSPDKKRDDGLTTDQIEIFSR